MQCTSTKGQTNLDPLLLVLGEHALLDHLGLYRNASQPFEPEPHIPVEFVLGLFFFASQSRVARNHTTTKTAPWPVSQPEQIQSVFPIQYHDLGRGSTMDPKLAIPKKGPYNNQVRW
jgi:hypothetical protein